jgi:hypothetical protein
LEEQARVTGLALDAFDLRWPCSNDECQRIMVGAFETAIWESVSGIAFGGLFLEDVLAYQQEQLKGNGLEPLFPVWGNSNA